VQLTIGKGRFETDGAAWRVTSRAWAAAAARVGLEGDEDEVLRCAGELWALLTPTELGRRLVRLPG